MAKAEDKTDSSTQVVDPESTTIGKGRPTPTRREREEANRRPLVATGKEAQKAQRARLAEVRERQRVGMANGEEKFLPERDKGPQRKFIRDYVDARYSVGEAMIPIMVLVIVMSIIQVAAIQMITLFVLWGFFIVAVIDCLVVGRLVTSKLTEKYGAGNVQRGNKWYAAMRAMQMKPMRMPKPQIKRGQYPTV
ncbi:DUF3043 domain-containing protein [Frigoribacterium sp. CFBP9039]|uniref:DUF3043 domain-containing protein n=1 Tax=Frigoribacterium TaxID=96492 RepID=UPI00177C3C38|nr:MULTISPECIES: DUF3043 domain-containing protein [Frigoribacterium]MBD8703577.1 DUF3043 domain-containing protein [Frigoribacterium sp. CFBP 13712]MCJ0700199.1 DUF3043 domain-containing protein [Frigoribacterium faeni]MDY0890914.1 DUF3043 domain-containing protein [Frigoribacterium sp. CFBP9030]MDY0945127.1 DUF3043 domain-containing protein [Frigoribacterium sp. CFBP9039]